jgi:hypothetical protein
MAYEIERGRRCGPAGAATEIATDAAASAAFCRWRACSITQMLMCAQKSILDKSLTQ